MITPVYLIEITQRCSYNCKPCFDKVVVAHEHEELKLWEWLLIVESIAENEGKMIIGGGEPLLREDIFDIIRFARALAIETELITCGAGLSKSTILELKNTGVEGIILRLDGADKHENDTFRGTETYYDTMEALKTINENDLNCSLLIRVANREDQLESGYNLSDKFKIPVYLSRRDRQWPDALVKLQLIKQKPAISEGFPGIVIDAEGKGYRMGGGGLQYFGDLRERRYRVTDPQFIAC